MYFVEFGFGKVAVWKGVSDAWKVHCEVIRPGFVWVKGTHLGEASFVVDFLEEYFELVLLVSCRFFLVAECFVRCIVGGLGDGDPFFSWRNLNLERRSCVFAASQDWVAAS